MTRKKVAALFIDAENLYYIQKGLGWQVDFLKLVEFLEKHFELYNSFFYTVVDKTSDSAKEKDIFLDSLSFAGYTVRRKMLKIIQAGDKTIKKGNVDIEMVVDMFNTKDLYDVAILFSGDSDFERALELLRSNGKEIIVISAKGYVAKELINVADRYVDLSTMKKDVCDTPSKSKKKALIMPERS